MNPETQTNGGEAVQLPLEKEPSSFSLVSALGIAGLLAGLILVGVYLFTLPMIEANKAEALRKAIYKVLPGCTDYKTLELVDGQLVERNEEQTSEGSKSREKPKQIFAGYNDSGKLVGFAINAEEPGFQDLIGAIFGYDPAKAFIIGFEVLESKETPGLGDKIMKDEDFIANFTALEVAPAIVAVKKGKKSKPNEVESITGATISSKAVVRLLNKGMVEWRGAIDDYMKNEE